MWRTMKHTYVTMPHARIHSIHGRAYARVQFQNWTLKFKLIHSCLHGCVAGHVRFEKACKTVHAKKEKNKRERTIRKKKGYREKRENEKEKQERYKDFSDQEYRDLSN